MHHWADDAAPVRLPTRTHGVCTCLLTTPALPPSWSQIRAAGGSLNQPLVGPSASLQVALEVGYRRRCNRRLFYFNATCAALSNAVVVPTLAFYLMQLQCSTTFYALVAAAHAAAEALGACVYQRLYVCARQPWHRKVRACRGQSCRAACRVHSLTSPTWRTARPPFRLRCARRRPCC